MKEENTIETIKLMIEHGHLTQDVAEKYFPELTESEDEKIRKELLAFIDVSTLSIDERHDRWLAWLEKQKSITDDEYEQGKKDVLWCIKQAKKNAKDENEMGTCWFAEKWLEKQGEQKHEWSKEDEECLENAIMYCEWARDKAPDIDCYDTTIKSIDWLKSLRPQKIKIEPYRDCDNDEELAIAVNALEKAGQYDSAKWIKHIASHKQWKPTIEQLVLFEGILDYHGSDFSSEGLRVMKEILAQLKEL